jgi:YkoP domain
MPCSRLNYPIAPTGWEDTSRLAVDTGISCVAEIARVSNAAEIGTPYAACSDEAWAGAVGWCDTVLRRAYRVQEFINDPACIFRVGLSKARRSLSLSDGTRIEAGEAIGSLHFWNEHLPRQAAAGPSLGWACIMHRRIVHSLEALVQYIESDRVWRGVKALHAEAALSTGLRRSQVERVVRRYGFEVLAAERSPLQRLHDLGDDFLLWGLARAFNPDALSRLRLFREHRDLWISRSSLERFYGPGRQACGVGSPADDEA